MQCNANMLVPDAQQPPADQDNDMGDNRDPCPEDEEYFDRQDAATMEEAITWSMDGMEAQEHSGFNDLYGLLGRLPVPTAKASQAMTHKDALEGCFIPSMTEEEQKLFTPSELSFTSMPWNTGTNLFDCSAYKECTCTCKYIQSTYRYVPSTYYFVPSMYLVNTIIDGISHRWTVKGVQAEFA
jgi:hypothetical protein